MNNPSWYGDVKKVFDSYNVPEYIWRPIAIMESGLNPNSKNVTSRESSFGLFQINTKANPRFSTYDLTDPVVNSQIAVEYFIYPAYQKLLKKNANSPTGLGITSPASQTAYVWKNGIKPAWTDEKEKKITAEVQKFLGEVRSGETGIEIPSLLPSLPSIDIDGIATNIGIYFSLVLVLLFSAYIVFRPKEIGEVLEGVK